MLPYFSRLSHIGICLRVCSLGGLAVAVYLGIVSIFGEGIDAALCFLCHIPIWFGIFLLLFVSSGFALSKTECSEETLLAAGERFNLFVHVISSIGFLVLIVMGVDDLLGQSHSEGVNAVLAAMALAIFRFATHRTDREFRIYLNIVTVLAVVLTGVYWSFHFGVYMMGMPDSVVSFIDRVFFSKRH